MKQSRFNSVFSRDCADGSREGVVFNSLTGAVAHLDSDGMAALCGEDNANEGLRSELAEGGFLVADELDEHHWLSEHFLEDMNRTDFLSLCIAPTMACNLRCPYCYEEHESVRMKPEMEDAIAAFVEKRHAWNPIELLLVLWYGGEPTLEVDLIERLGGRLKKWAEDNDVIFKGMMVSNASLIDDDMAVRLAASGVQVAMPTFDGCASCHDSRSVRIDGSGSYEATLAGAKALANAGVYVSATCNLDGANVDGFRALREKFADEEGIDISAAHLRNYHGWCENLRDGASQFDLLSRKEFADKLFELYAETEPSAAGIYDTLRSRRMFCQGKFASYFNIDPEGNVCRCDGDMRNSSKVMFNLLDNYELDWPETESFADKNSRCAECGIAPTCLGQCEWEWKMFGENCSPLKYTLDKYVWLLHDKLAEGAGDMPSVCALVPPRDFEAEYAEKFTPLNAQGLI